MLHIETFDPHEPWDPPQHYIDMYDPGYTGRVLDAVEAFRFTTSQLDWLADAGCEVVTLDINADFPDSVFVEDNAVVVDEVAVFAMDGDEETRADQV